MKARTLDDQEWLTPRGIERTHQQNNINVKLEQLKLSKTYLLI
jgi:hypothetical protein